MEEYTLQELKEKLKISKRQWEERKEEVLEYMKLFFDYDIVIKDGKGYKFIIKEQYCDYEPLPRKTKSKEISKFYEEEARHIIKYKPRNTSVNIAREINDMNNKYNHKLGTITNYVRPFVKENYTIDEKEWCYVDYATNEYVQINKEQRDFLKELFQKYLTEEGVVEALAMEDAGYIDEKVAYKMIKSRYNAVMTLFKKEYGFRPFKVGKLREKAF